MKGDLGLTRKGIVAFNKMVKDSLAKGIEHAVAFESGNPIKTWSGGDHHVELNDFPERADTLAHCHQIPTGGCFSAPDIMSFVNLPQLKKTVVSHMGKAVYVLEKPENYHFPVAESLFEQMSPNAVLEFIFNPMKIGAPTKEAMDTVVIFSLWNDMEFTLAPKMLNAYTPETINELRANNQSIKAEDATLLSETMASNIAERIGLKFTKIGGEPVKVLPFNPVELFGIAPPEALKEMTALSNTVGSVNTIVATKRSNPFAVIKAINDLKTATSVEDMGKAIEGIYLNHREAICSRT